MSRAIRSLSKLTALATMVVAIGANLAGEARAQAPTYVGTFAMTNIDSGKCATADTATARVSRNPWNAGQLQHWAFLLLPNGYFAIFNIKTGQFLTDGTEGPITPVGALKWTGSPTQQWYLYPFGNNVYALVNVGSGKVLDDEFGNSTMSGLDVSASYWHSSRNQYWYLYFLYK